MIFDGKCHTLLMREAESLNEDEAGYIRKAYIYLGREKFLEFVNKEKITPYAAHILNKIGCDSGFWGNIHNGSENRSKKILILLEEIFKEFQDAGCSKVCVVENMGTILLADSCIGCFASGDVDLYADYFEMEKVEKVVGSFGFRCGDRHKRKKVFAREYYNQDIIEGGLWLNFQWKPVTRLKTHLFDQRKLTKRFLYESGNLINIEGTNIKSFCYEALLYFNIQHIASAHYFTLTPGLRLYADIDRLVRNHKIDWEIYRRWCEEDDNGIRGDMSLYISKIFFGSPIPESAFSENLTMRRFIKFTQRLFSESQMLFYKKDKNIISYIIHLIYVELASDGVLLIKAFLKRLYVIIFYRD